METVIKAIETIYNGYRFRSRLEARWAVFFDKAGIRYEYEHEGFELDDGTKYLPDFFLPSFNCYVEIKPSRELDDGKAEKFGLSDTPGILICYGQPADHDLRFITNWESDESGGGSYDTDWGPFYTVRFTRYKDGTGPCIYVDDSKSERCFYEVKRIGCVYEMYGKVIEPDHCISILWAEGEAKKARFEHREKPVVNPYDVFGRERPTAKDEWV